MSETGALPSCEGEMATRIRRHDWASTSLGPASAWPQSLHSVVDLMLAMPSPATILWGPDHVQLYNDAYRAIAKDRHPELLGLPVAEGWADVHEAVIAPLLGSVHAGRGTRLVDFRVALRTADGRDEDRYFDCDWTPIRDESGSVAGALQTLAEVTERHRAQDAAWKSEERNAFLVRFSDAVRSISDPTQVAKQTCRILSEQLGTDRTLWAVIDWEAREYVSDWVFFADGTTAEPSRWPFDEREPFAAEHLAGRPVVYDDVRLEPRIPDPVKAVMIARGLLAGIAVPVLVGGKLVAVLNTSQGNAPRRWSTEEVAFVEALAQRAWSEIERTRTEAALRASEEKYRSLFESMDEAYAVVEVLKDEVGRWADFRFLDANPAFMEHTSMPYPVGKTATELLGTPNPRWTELYGQALDTHSPIRVEEVEPTLGRVFDLNIFSLDHKRNRVAVLFTDITARTQVEAALRESEEQFRTLADTAPALIWRNDAKGENLFINRHFLDFTGKSAEEIRGEGWHTLVHPDEAAAYVDDYLAAVKAQRAWNATNRIRRYDGAWRWFENYAQPVSNAEGDYAGHVGVSVDITDRVEAEQALRALQERQSFLLELSDALRPIHDAYEVQTTTTRLVAEHLNVDRSMYGEVEGEPGAETGTIRAQFVRQSAEGQPTVARFPERFTFDPFGAHTMAARYRGEPLVVRDVKCHPSFEEAERDAWRKAGVRAAIVAPLAKAGRLVAEFGVHCVEARNWTDEEVVLIQEVAERTWAAVERARAEAALRESEARFQMLAASIEDVFYITDVERGQLAYLSPAYERVWKRPGRELMNDLGRFRETMHPDDRADMEGNLARQLAGEPVVAQYRIVQPDGSVRHIFDQSYPVPGAEGRLSAGIARDVTDARLTTSLLEESEARLRSLIEGMPQLVWRAVDDGQWTWASPQWTEFTGQEEEASHGSGWLEVLHPDDRPLAMDAWKRAQTSGGFEVEYRVRNAKEGRYRWFKTKATPMRGPQGAILEWLGTSTDIDDQRSALEALRDSEERFRQFGEASSDLLWIRDAETLAFEYVSPAFERLYGVGREDVLGSHDVEAWLALIHPDDRAEARTALECLREGALSKREFRVIHPDGSLRWIQNTDFPIRNGGGKVQRIAGIAQDITEQKRAVELQATLLAELQHRVRNLLAMIRSIVRRASIGKESVRDFVDHLEGRIDAMARTQSMLTRSPGREIELQAILEEELLAQVADPKHYSLKGPQTALPPKVAEVVTLAIHELTTNSVKYGAIGRQGAFFFVTWSKEECGDEVRLAIRWRETGVPCEGKAPRAGFGTELLTRRVPFELGGKVDLEFLPDGLTATLEFPLRHAGSVLQTDARVPAGE